MEIKIDPETIQGLVEEAILAKISTEQRDTIMAAAVKHLVSPQTNGMGRPTYTPIQNAFNTAVERAAFTIVNEMLGTNDELKAELRASVTQVVDAICAEDPYSGLPEAVGDAVGGAVREWLMRERRRAV